MSNKIILFLLVISFQTIVASEPECKSNVARLSFSQRVEPVFGRAHLRGIVDTYSHQIQQALTQLQSLYAMAQQQINALSVSDQEKKEAIDTIKRELDITKVLQIQPGISQQQLIANKRLYDILTASSRSLESVDKALIAGADPNGYYKNKPIIFYIFKNWATDQIPSLLQLFKRHGFMINSAIASDDKKNSLLQQALITNAVIVPHLLKIFPDIQINYKDAQGNTALHYAARNKGYEYIPELLKFGAQIDIQNNAGETPSLVAAKWRSKLHTKPNAAALGILIKHGANPLIEDTDKHDASFYLAEFPELKKEIDEYMQRYKKEQAAKRPAASSASAQ